MKHLKTTMAACVLMGLSGPAFAAEVDLEAICALDNIPEDQRDAVKEICDSVRLELVKAQIEDLRNAAKLEGLDTDAPNEGTTTLNGVATGYASVLAVQAAARAGGEMGGEICRQARGRTIYFGMPQQYRQSANLKKHYLRRIKSLQSQHITAATAITQATQSVSTLEVEVNNAIVAAQAQPEENGGTDEIKNFLAPGVVTAVGQIIGTTNVLNDLTKLVRSNVTITGISPDIPDEAVAYAIKSGITAAARTQGGCRIASPESNLDANDPLEGELNSLYIKLSDLQGTLDTLVGQMTTSVARIRLVDTNAADDLKETLTGLETKARTIVNNASTESEKIWTELATASGSGATPKTTLLDRIISADVAVRDRNAVFLDARQVKSAAAQVHSKGLFRTDRLHFSGSVVVGYELVDRTGHTLGSGMFDASRAEQIRDRTGFNSRNGRITSFDYAPTVQPTYRPAPRPAYAPQHVPSYAPRYAPSETMTYRPTYVQSIPPQTIYTYESGR